jgi:hypothetical protein
MYDLKDIARKDFTLLNEFDIVKIDGVEAVTVKKVEGKEKIITVHLPIYDYLFSNTLKTAIKSKIINDLGITPKIKFGI